MSAAPKLPPNHFDPPPPGSVEVLMDGVWKNNPVFVQVLGLCPTMAVTSSVRNAFAMGAATAFVLVCSSALVSMMRRFVPKQIRIATYLLIIATFVTIADYLIKATSISVYRALGPFIALIVVNCLILGRSEAFAGKNPLGKSILDAAGMGAGFFIALLCLGSVREVIGNGTFLGMQLFGAQYEPWVILLLPAGGFFTLATWLIVFSACRNWIDRKRMEKAAHS